MRKIILLLLLVISLSGRAIELEEVAASPETFLVCKTLDIASTSYIISHGIGYEANPIVAPLITNGYLPLVLLSAGVYWLLKQTNDNTTTTLANVMTCGVAIHNLLLIP